MNITTICRHTTTAAALAAALAANLGAASHAQAQELDETGPLGLVGWSTAASFCKVLPNSAASNVNYVSGTVNFTSTSSGTIGLACTVPGISNGLVPTNINAFAVEFLNANGHLGGCTIGAYFVDRTTGLNSGWSTGQTYGGSGVWTANIGLTSHTYPLDMTHTYEVDVYLFRPATATAVCNPQLYAAYVEDFVEIL